MGVVGCILGFLIVIYLVYKDWSVYVATFIGMVVVALLTGSDLVEAISTTYVDGVFTAISSFFFVMMFGCVQSYLYRESGAAFWIATKIMNVLIRGNASRTAKNCIGMLTIIVIGFILSMGGIIAGVVIVLMYPISLVIFQRCEIPKRFILGVLGAACYTFSLTIPGSPQVTNVAAMTALGTASTVAPIPGIVGAIVEVIVTLLILNALMTRAQKRGEVFERHPLDPSVDPDTPHPNFIICLIPMIFLFVLFSVFHINIVICLVLSCLLSMVVFWPQLRGKNLKEIWGSGTVDSVPMTMNVGAICGFAAIITNSDAFQTMLNAITSLDASPILICGVVVAIMCMLTGGSSTGQLIALPIIAPRLLDMGLSVNVIHRVSAFAATTLDSMPYCGSILMLLPMCHMKLKEIYPPMFVTTVIATTCGTIAVGTMCALFPGLAG